MDVVHTRPHLGEAGPHPVIASAARELLNKSENERSGVLSTAMSFLGLYRDPVVAQVTRAGNRKLNSALHVMAVCQVRADTAGRAYYERKIADGKTHKEAIRCLKRRLSDIVFKVLVDDLERSTAVAA